MTERSMPVMTRGREELFLGGKGGRGGRGRGRRLSFSFSTSVFIFVVNSRTSRLVVKPCWYEAFPFPFGILL